MDGGGIGQPLVSKERTYVGDQEDDVVQTESINHDRTHQEAQANSDRVHNHEHNHSSLKAILVRTHSDVSGYCGDMIETG